MSQALKCDRCNDCFDPFAVEEPEYFLTIKGSVAQNGRQLEECKYTFSVDRPRHLCPTCAKMYDKFMKMEYFTSYIPLPKLSSNEYEEYLHKKVMLKELQLRLEEILKEKSQNLHP